MTRKTLDAISLGVAGIGLFVGAFVVWGGFRGAAKWAVGRAGNCPLDQCVEAARISKEDFDRGMAVFKASKVVETSSDNKLQLWDTPAGKWWIPAGNDGILPALIVEQERQIYGHGENGVKPGDVVMDCGAHVGVFAREALSKGASLVVAIEPAPRNLECLRRNLKAEIEAGKVKVVPKAVWDKEDVGYFDDGNLDSGAGAHLVDSKEKSTIRVDLTRLDKIAEELQLAKVDFIKMDIEGAERQALEGGKGIVTRHKPRLALAAYHLPDDITVLQSIAMRLNPAYRVLPRLCSEHGWASIGPRTLLFWQ